MTSLIFQWLCPPGMFSGQLELSRALRLVVRAIDEGRAAIRGVHDASPATSSLEQAFSTGFSEVTSGRNMRIRVFVQ
jgi:hypothetical protein